MPETLKDKTINHKNSTGDCQKRNLPRDVWVPLLLETEFSCPIPAPDCIGVGKTILEFHHIEPWNVCRNHDHEKMIAVCPSCHYRLDRGEISRDTIFKIKKRLRNRIFRNENIVDNSVLNLGNLSMLSRLSREGNLIRLQKVLTSVTNYILSSKFNQSIIPDILFLQVRTLRKLSRETTAQKILSKIEDNIFESLTPSQKYLFHLTKGAVAFNFLNYDFTIKELNNLKIYSPQQEDLSFSVAWREIIARQNLKSRSKIDIDEIMELGRLSPNPNNYLTALLTMATVKKKDISKDWLDEVEKVYDILDQSISLTIAGFESHTVGELMYLASGIFESKGKKASARRCTKLYEPIFRNSVSAKHVSVYEL